MTIKLSLDTVQFVKWGVAKLSDCPDCTDSLKVIHAEMAKSMMLKIDDMLISGDSSHKTVYSTAKLMPSVTLTKESLDNALKMMLRSVSPVERMKNAIIKLLRDMGLHPDMLDKVEYAMSTAQGQMVIEKITLNDMRDIETLVQKFVKIYQDVTR